MKTDYIQTDTTEKEPSARPKVSMGGKTDGKKRKQTAKPPYASLTARQISIALCAVCAVVFFVWGLLFFWRPVMSETEKRVLTPFPALTWDGFWSGDWTEQISVWYADTFPGRDALTEAYHGIRSLYGFRDEQFQGGEGDDVPDGTMPDDYTAPDEPETNDPTAHGGGETIGGYYVSGDTAYELYYFKEANAYRYAALVKRAQEQLKGKAQVYDMVIPLNYTFSLGADIQKQLGVADGQKVMSYLYSGMGSDVKTVDVYTALMAHRDEYIFFRTDHHWTATGAYWAYDAFCRAAGITPNALSSYEKLTFEGFLGTLYAKTEQPAALKNRPDSVDAYVPRGTNTMTVLDRDGNTTTAYPIVQRKTDTFYQNAASKYNCFIAGDNPLTVIHNPQIASSRKGTSILLIKESFGNAFAPFLVDSYEYIYILDYRYYKGEPNGSGGWMNTDLYTFVKAHDIQTVLFLNNVDATTGAARLSEMENLVN